MVVEADSPEAANGKSGIVVTFHNSRMLGDFRMLVKTH